MKLDFWKQVWKEQRLGFDQGEPNYYLKKVLPSWLSESYETIFVPLCGRSVDMWEIHRAGHHVTGVEFCEGALLDFDKKFSLNLEKISVRESVDCFRNLDFKLYCADFFNLNAADIKKRKGSLKIWDRAALVALPPDMRFAYYDQVDELNIDRLDWLCLLFSFDAEPDFGPPFPVDFEEVHKIMTKKGYCVEIVEERSLRPQNPKFIEAGIHDFKETLIRVYG